MLQTRHLITKMQKDWSWRVREWETSLLKPENRSISESEIQILGSRQSTAIRSLEIRSRLWVMKVSASMWRWAPVSLCPMFRSHTRRKHLRLPVLTTLRKSYRLTLAKSILTINCMRKRCSRRKMGNMVQKLLRLRQKLGPNLMFIRWMYTRKTSQIDNFIYSRFFHSLSMERVRLSSTNIGTTSFFTPRQGKSRDLRLSTRRSGQRRSSELRWVKFLSILSSRGKVLEPRCIPRSTSIIWLSRSVTSWSLKTPMMSSRPFKTLSMLTSWSSSGRDSLMQPSKDWFTSLSKSAKL